MCYSFLIYQQQIYHLEVWTAKWEEMKENIKLGVKFNKDWMRKLMGLFWITSIWLMNLDMFNFTSLTQSQLLGLTSNWEGVAKENSLLMYVWLMLHDRGNACVLWYYLFHFDRGRLFVLVWLGDHSSNILLTYELFYVNLSIDTMDCGYWIVFVHFLNNDINFILS